MQGANVILHKIRLNGFDSSFNIKTEANRNISFSKKIIIGADKPVSQPFWLAEKMNKGSYNINDQLLIGKPEPDPALEAYFEVRIEGQSFTFTKPVIYKHTDPVKGEIYEPLPVIPPVSDPGPYGVLRQIKYDHIPDIFYFSKDTASISISGVKIEGKKIGYIEGAGDKVPAALKLLGYEVTILKKNDILPEYLSQFDAIITGVRAYNVHSLSYR